MFLLSKRAAPSPVSLMKLTRIDSPEDLLKDYNKNNIIVEEKLDGFKIQVIKDGKVKVYSRNGIDKTANVPDVVNALNFLPDKTFVEGELVYIEGGKQHLEKVTSLIGGGPEKSITKQKEMPGQLKFYIYDILLLKGKKISDKPFSERRKILESLIKKSKFVDITKQYSFDKWQDAMKIAKEKNEEGIVLKLKDKPYAYKSLGQNEPKPKYMFKFKGGIGKSDSDDYVVYDYKLGEKGKLKALFGQYYKGKLYGISELSNFSKENEEIIKNKLKKEPFVIEIGFGERVPGGLRHQKFNRYRDDKDPKDCTMDKYHAQYIDNFKVVSQKNDDNQVKIAAVSDDIINALKSKISPSTKELPSMQRQIAGVDTQKAFEIISTLESNGNYIIGDSGTSFGKTQVQFGGFLSHLLKEPNTKEITGLDKQEISDLKAAWENAKTKFKGINFWKTVPANIEKVKNEIKINPKAVVKRIEGTTIRINPDTNPGVVKIKNKQFVGYELDLDKLQSLGLDVNSYRSSLQKLMDNYITDNVVYSGISKIYVSQQAPVIYNKFMKVFSKSNVDKDQKLKNLTDNISKTD